jgi:A/G-specific adenine glycosylase
MPDFNTPALLSWFARTKRPLPWRQQVNPYRTLVSELMLQQTRVETVIPYFDRFMTSFPTVEDLARASIERVLEHWSGLGYYSRARNLHAAARAVVEQGGFPSTVEGLQKLPGVGPYTAGAVASLAMGLDAALVDGNVERVLCRFDAREEEPVKIKKELWARTAALLPAGQAGAFNEALMELGATVCTPQSPRCLICPIQPGCQGKGDPERYPKKAEKKAVPQSSAFCLVARQEDKILLGQRPEGGLLAGLWEPPLAYDKAELNGSLIEKGKVVHVFSHLKLTVQVFYGPLHEKPPGNYAAFAWVPEAEVDSKALSTLARKLLKVGLQS